jgi:hypothetical protein
MPAEQRHQSYSTRVPAIRVWACAFHLRYEGNRPFILSVGQWEDFVPRSSLFEMVTCAITICTAATHFNN